MLLPLLGSLDRLAPPRFVEEVSDRHVSTAQTWQARAAALPAGVVRHHLAQMQAVKLTGFFQVFAGLSGGPGHERAVFAPGLKFIRAVTAKVLDDDGVTSRKPWIAVLDLLVINIVEQMA